MKLNITKNGNKQHSLKRVIAFIGLVICSFAFIKTAILGAVSAEMFLTYPLGLIILYVPQLAINMLKVYKGMSIEKEEMPVGD